MMARIGEGAAANVAAPRLLRVWRWQRLDRLLGLAFLLPAALYVLAFYVYPLIYNFLMSVGHYTAKSFVTGEAPFVGLGNFRRLVSDPEFGTAVWNTIVFAVASLFFQFVIGLVIAVFFQRKFPLSGL